MDDLEDASGCQSEHTDDVHTNPWELCLGSKPGSKIWMGRLEYMGNLPGDRSAAGVSIRDGHHFRGQKMEEEKTCGGRNGRFSQWPH